MKNKQIEEGAFYPPRWMTPKMKNDVDGCRGCNFRQLHQMKIRLGGLLEFSDEYYRLFQIGSIFATEGLH